MAFLAITSIHASDSNKSHSISFSDLPYEEGTLFVEVNCGDKSLLRTFVEVDKNEVVMPVDLSDYVGCELTVRAFQDLNGNHTLDFDSYGRPQEPCLQTKAKVDKDANMLRFKLIQY